MKTVIMAGGAGTRISSIFPDIPKPLIPIEGVPVLEREISSLAGQGFCDIILTVSHMADKLIGHFGDGKRLGVNIDYFVEKTPLGNAGALYELKEKLSDDFLLLNADTVFDVDFNRFVEYHRSKGALATLLTHPNDHPYDSGLIVADENMSVTDWYTKEDVRPRYYKNRVNAGLHVLSKELLGTRPDTAKVDLDRQILRPLAGSGRIFCYDSPEYVKDMGTPQRFESVCKDFASGKVAARNLKNKQKAIFLDRDGTINREVGFLRSVEELELLPRSAQAVKLINDSGYLAIVVTNQPVIARGEVTEPELNEIHNRMETLLGENAAYIDRLYYCPHHPDSGFEGEVPSLKIKCSCRKPAPGMLLKAADELNIDLAGSWMIGDRNTDILAGINAGTKTARIVDDTAPEDSERRLIDTPADITGSDLYDVITQIMRK
ncbi:MAG: HAD-IIIA family hydrolase [Lachnospiraceae bacterium]|nr:HAD-IIIA family hydrolase [Lachnospiraceae bacterium]